MTITEEQKSNLKEFLKECVANYLSENHKDILNGIDLDKILFEHIRHFKIYELPDEVEKTIGYIELKATVNWLENRLLQLEEKLNNENKMRL
jgi:uncharacterized membrane protein YheB (UPF0754 family)